MATARHFNRVFASAVLVVFAVTGVTNWLVDPFALFGSPPVTGFNVEKPAFGRYVRMEKAMAIRELQPRALILGSSRAELGLDPDHPAWATHPVYNAAMPSGSISEAWQYLQHAHAVTPLQQVVLNLDMFMFNAMHQYEPGFQRDRLAQNDTLGFNGAMLRDVVTALFSINALQTSFETVARQNQATHLPHLANGMRDTARNAARIASKGGQHAAFLSNERYSLSANDGWGSFSLSDPETGARTPLVAFTHLLEFCLENHIDCRLMISPVHARKLEVLWALDMWPVFEDWKRSVVQTLASVQQRYSDRAIIPLMDFSGYNRITTESLPAPGDTTSVMRWYWEGSHFRKETGDIMLTRLLQATPAAPDDDFGTNLTPASLPTALANARAGHERYVATHPADLLEIRNEVSETMETRQAVHRRTFGALSR